MTQAEPRIIFVDDNIRGVGGHFLELASLMIEGAKQLGHAPTLVTNRDFAATQSTELDCPILPNFRQRRLVRWSVGVDGMSRVIRNDVGAPGDRSLWRNLRQQITDHRARPDRYPTRMISDYAQDLAHSMQQLQIDSNDITILNTSDDFSLIALAQAIDILQPSCRLNIHALFHFAVYEQGQADQRRQLDNFGHQINRSLTRLTQHDIQLHATTAPLTDQMNQSGIDKVVTEVPYPTRRRLARDDFADHGRARVVLAGLPRAEKGRDAISGLLADMSDRLLNQNRLCMSMQMPVKRWQRMVPQSLRPSYHRALELADEFERQSTANHHGDLTARCVPAIAHGPLEILRSNLDTDTYHDWLDAADIGLFLYDAARYVARCSGVLLEMLSRGVPVVVPNDCWLAEFVRQMSDEDPCGMIYENRSDIPAALEHLVEHHHAFRKSAARVAVKIADKHNGQNTLRTMGIGPSSGLGNAASKTLQGTVCLTS